MKYMGSKARIAKYILPIILKDRAEGQWYVEPFVGGANMIDKVQGNRIGADINPYLIGFWKALQGGWIPPIHTTMDEYYSIKNNKENNIKMTFWAGIGCSYCGKWFGGYVNDYPENRRNKKGILPNFQKEARGGLLKQLPSLEGVIFITGSYDSFAIPPNSIIYCDPPYANTTKYKDKFNHTEFWQWCRDMKNQGHQVFISEYNAPDDFTCVKEIKTNTQLGNGCKTGNQIKTEKLFIYAPH